MKGRQFYHGTKAELKVGDHIVPASEVHPRSGGDAHSNYGDLGEEYGQPSRENAYASTDWDSAKYFAGHSRDWHKTGLSGNVYPVEPVGTPRKGVYSSFHEYLAPSWRITGPPEHTKPVRKGEYRQGTLPVDFGPTARHDIYPMADAANQRSKDLRDDARVASSHGNFAEWQRLTAASLRERRRKDSFYILLDRYDSGQEPAHRIRSRQFDAPSRLDAPEPKQKPVKNVKGQLRLF